MILRKKNLNIILLILAIALGGWAVWLYRRPPLVLSKDYSPVEAKPLVSESIADISTDTPAVKAADAEHGEANEAEPDDRVPGRATSRVELTRFNDFDPRVLQSDNPFRPEAEKILSGRLEETDSLSRHKILSYCEHLRTSYTTRDIDFIRQVFSDNALIIVGQVVRTGGAETPLSSCSGVKYSVRSKHEYLERLSRIFDSGKNIDVRFSDFRIMRHPTVKGLYGVTLRQKYTCGSYSDDGYLFLLWDFRDMSMPLIHVRTWQRTISLGNSEDELIDISDFNLE